MAKASAIEDEVIEKGFKKICFNARKMFLNGTAMPGGYTVYGHQVAGHRFETGKQGMLLDSDGKLLKPIQAPPRGEREVEFYQTVFGCETSDQSILRLRQFVPTFHGVKHVVFPGLPFKVDNYIILENLTRHFNKPCILDIKIGKCVTDHRATEAKRERAFKKYPQQEEFGFRILGMKFFSKSCEHFTFYDKTFGKNLRTQAEILMGLKEFFCQEEHGKGHIEEILKNLEAIKLWALEQRIFRLYSSSVLIIYEGNKINCMVTENLASDFNTMPNRDSAVKEQTEKSIQGTNAINNSELCSAKLCTGTSALQNGYSNFADMTNSAAKCKDMHNCWLQNETHSRKPNVGIHLVDFAHTYIGHYQAPDSNYLYGLDNLIQYVGQLLDSNV